MTRFVIVGSGAAGISAAEAIRACEPLAEIVMIGQEGPRFYSRPGLAYYLSGEVPESLLFPFGPADFDRLNLNFVAGRAVRIVPDAHLVDLAGGSRVPYDRLLIATGSAAAGLEAPGADLAGVVKLDTLEDAHGIVRLLRARRSAVVVGGGITALEIVEGLRARGMLVHYFMRQGRYWSNVLDESESRIVEDRLTHQGVVIHPHTELAEILGRNGKVSGVRTTAGQEIRCDLVACAVGVWPQAGLARDAGLAVSRGILVDEHMQTSEPDVYAAGDVAEVFDPMTGKTTLDTLWWIARAEGRTAGRNMAGEPVPFKRGVPHASACAGRAGAAWPPGCASTSSPGWLGPTWSGCTPLFTTVVWPA